MLDIRLKFNAQGMSLEQIEAKYREGTRKPRRISLSTV